MCEHPKHVPFVHSSNIVITHVLSVHSLITMNTYVHLPIISNTAVLYYLTTPCSICTAESDRNTRSPSNISCPQEIFLSKCLIPPTGENKKSFFSVLEFLPCFFCKNCLSSFIPKSCRVTEGSEKCVACVNNGRFCNLVFLDTVK